LKTENFYAKITVLRREDTNDAEQGNAMKKKSSLFFVGREGAPPAENAPALSIGEVLFGAVRLKLK